MMAPVFAMLQTPEIIGLLVLALILFGAKKLPDLARGLGQGIKEFKKATRDVTDELQNAMDVDRRSSSRPTQYPSYTDPSSSESNPGYGDYGSSEGSPDDTAKADTKQESSTTPVDQSDPEESTESKEGAQTTEAAPVPQVNKTD